MADNSLKPSLSQVSQTSSFESSENHTGSSAILPSGGSGGLAIGSLSTMRVGYISSIGSTKNKRQPLEMEGFILVSPDLGDSNNKIIINNNNTTNDQKSDMVTIPRSRRQCGRPPVSKNKPKLPIFISQQNGTTLTPILINITTGTNVVEGLINFAHSHLVGISILSGFGPVSDVVICHPVSSAVPSHPIQGPIYIISLTGTYLGGHFMPPLPLPLPFSSNLPPSPSWPTCSCFSVLLSRTDGQVFGGVIGGKILAASTVMVMALLIRNFEIQRLHLINDNGGRDDDDEGRDGGDDDDDDDALFSSAVINSVKVIDVAGGGDGGGDNNSSGAIIRNNKCNAGGVNFNFLQNIAAAYCAVGSTSFINYQLVPVSASV